MKTGFIITSIFLLQAVLIAQQYPDMHIIAADPEGVTIEYTPQIKTKSITIDGRAYAAFLFRDAQQKSVREAGAPDLRFYETIIGTPSLEGNKVQVIRTEYADEQNVRINPVADWKRNEDSEYVPVYHESYSRYANQLLPDEVASIVKTGISRDRIIAKLRITPVQWNPVTRIARKYSRIVVRIQFGPHYPNLSYASRVKDNSGAAFILNNDQSDSWRIQSPQSLKKISKVNLASGDWYRIDVTEDGLYKIPRTWFEQAGINVSSLDPRTIKMYGCGGKELPIDITAPRPDNLQEIAIDVIGGDDGKFDSGDYLLFYGQGLTGFTYDSTLQRYRHHIHRFDVRNAYLLTFGGQPGKRIQTLASLNDPNPAKPQWFTGKAFTEDEKVNFIRSGRNWVGQKIAAGSSLDYSMKLDQRVSTQPVMVRSVLFSRADVGTNNSFTLDDHGNTLDTIPMGTVDLNTDRGDIAWQSSVQECRITGNIPDDRSDVRFTYFSDTPTRNEGGYVDWIEWYYAHSFVPTNDVLAFSSPDTTATIEYLINGFSNSDVVIYDVTDYANVVRISNPYISGGTVRFQAAVTAGVPHQYLSAASPAYKTANAAKKITNSGLLTSQGAEFIIITAPEFIDQAKRLKAHREREGEDKISTLVATTDDIYNEFNSGVTDPVALRNFIQYAFANWQVKPNYVLLFGNGHYDYLLHTSKEHIWVPVFETENSVNLIESYVTDDFYAQVSGNDDIVDVRIGRLPVRSVQEASDMVDKIIKYETGQAFEPWRNVITFVADDGPTMTGDDGNLHTSQAEQLSLTLPPEIEQKKIYILAYKTVYTSAGRRKPDANAAIIDQINAGTLITNYTGHGNESVWTHERVLVADVSIPQMKNADRFSFLSAATCAFGLYDTPDLRSGAEMLVVKPDGAMIGALASPRVVFSQENSTFNLFYFQNLLNTGREPDGRAKRVGDATYLTKQRLNGSAGFEKFHLFCDPTTRLLLPRHTSVIDQIVIDGTPATSDTVQLKALSKVTFNASVRKIDSTVWTDFNGISQVSLFDASRSVPVPEWGNWSYVLPGGLLYRGQATIKNGRYSVTFVVPKDITYENNTGRISLYIENNQTDGVGYSTKLQVSGTDTASGQVKPPLIKLYLDSRSFHPGDVVNENALLIVDLYDDFGINTTGNGIGHNIEGWLDGDPNSFVLNDYYKSKIDSYQEGSVEYMMRGMSAGKHTLKVRAWNIHNISATAETYFEVASSDNVALRNVLNYPNPMKDQTSFTFVHNMSEPVNVVIKIYTAAGRLIRKIESNNMADRFISIPWDGRDEDGDLIANGVYFYKLIVNTASGSKGSEVVEKLAVLK